MRKILIFVLFLSVGSLACGAQALPTATKNEEIPIANAFTEKQEPLRALPTPPLTQIIISREQVNLRNSAGVVEVAIQGDTFTGACDGTWCYIGNGRRVWQACTNQKYWADYEVCR